MPIIRNVKLLIFLTKKGANISAAPFFVKHFSKSRFVNSYKFVISSIYASASKASFLEAIRRSYSS